MPASTEASVLPAEAAFYVLIYTLSILLWCSKQKSPNALACKRTGASLRPSRVAPSEWGLSAPSRVRKLVCISGVQTAALTRDGGVSKRFSRHRLLGWMNPSSSAASRHPRAWVRGIASMLPGTPGSVPATQRKPLIAKSASFTMRG